jgi:hypothetical protein
MCWCVDRKPVVDRGQVTLIDGRNVAAPMEFANGLRVRVAPHAFWRGGAIGTVRPFPGSVTELVGDTEKCTRVFQGARGPLTMVWVVFDEPCQDGEGDGPYRQGEIMSEYLVTLR